MPDLAADVLSRIERLECSVQRTRILAGGLALALVALTATGFAPRSRTEDEIRTRRLVVVDDSGRARVIVGQDPAATQRRSRAAGLLIYDRTGAERGGFGTMDDGSVVLGLDAPVGVGSPMRDRIGLLVAPNGGSHVMLLDNDTRAVAKLESDGAGDGGVQVFEWDMARKVVHIRTMKYAGDVRDSVGMGQ